MSPLVSTNQHCLGLPATVPSAYTGLTGFTGPSVYSLAAHLQTASPQDMCVCLLL